MRPLMKLTLAALCASSATAVMAGKITPELEARLRLETDSEVIVYFQDVEPAVAAAHESQEQAIRRLQRNLGRTKAIVENELGFAGSDRIKQMNWVSNSVSMRADSAMVHEIARHPAVKRVLFDAPVEAPHTIPSSDEHPQEGDFTYGLLKLKIDQVREVYGLTGAGVRIGNIDTGADGSHPDLAGKIVAYKDPSGETTVPTDTQGHGTHTAATMVGGNAGGTWIGVAPDAELVVARGIAGSSTLSNLLASMDWIMDPDGDPATHDAPVVVSMSWHTGSGDQSAFYEALGAFEAAGIIPNFSAGNSGTSGLTHPKEYPGTVTNAATDSEDGIASFSSRGPAFYNGVEQKKPEWACPGVDVYSAKPGGGYQKMSGTSMAAPHGAGVIGLLFQADPTLTPAQVREVLQSTADDLGAPGWDTSFGAGRLNALKAVSLVASGGKVLGKVVDAAGQPVSFARLRILEKDFAFGVKADGSFKLMLPEGSYTFETSAFGYLTQQASVTVVADTELNLDVTLEAAESFPVAGTVSAKEGGQGVAGARVLVVGTPLEAVQTADDGGYSLTLPQGVYTFQVMAFGFQIASRQVTVPEGDASFELDPLPPILVVDDDAGKSYETFYTGALAALGQEYGTLDAASAQMDDTTLLPYQTVIWFTGDDYSNTLSSDDQTRLEAYVANGGKLILSGQDIGYQLKSSPFYANVLKAEFKKDSAGVTKVSGLGLELDIAGGDGANNQKYPDVIAAREGAEVLFSYAEGKGDAGLKVGESIAYLAFGLEAVSTAEGRAALLGKLLGATEGDTRVDTVTPARRGVARRDAFGRLFQ